MEYEFKVGDKVEVVMTGYGCGPDEIGIVSTITELGFYKEGPGYKVNKLENKRYDDFIGEDSFKLYSPVVNEADHQHPAVALAASLAAASLAAAIKSTATTSDYQLEEQVLETQPKVKKAPDILSAGIERTTPVTSTMSSLYPDYYKSCVGITELDVYTVHHLFNINDPSGCIQHASKKLLLSGVRTGGKSAYNDIKEARDTLTRKLQLMEQFEENV